MKLSNLISSVSVLFLLLVNNVLNASQVNPLNDTQYENENETALRIEDNLQSTKNLLQEMLLEPADDLSAYVLEFCGQILDAKFAEQFIKQTALDIINDIEAKSGALEYIQGIKNSNVFKQWIENPEADDLKNDVIVYMKEHFAAIVSSLVNKKSSLSCLLNFQIWCEALAYHNLPGLLYWYNGNVSIVKNRKDADDRTAKYYCLRCGRF